MPTQAVFPYWWTCPIVEDYTVAKLAYVNRRPDLLAWAAVRDLTAWDLLREGEPHEECWAMYYERMDRLHYAFRAMAAERGEERGLERCDD